MAAHTTGPESAGPLSLLSRVLTAAKGLHNFSMECLLLCRAVCEVLLPPEMS